MVETRIVNVVATAALGQRIDLEEIRKFKEIFHDSDVYGGRVAYFKTENMQGKVSIFPSGKMISVGTKSEEDAFRELERAKKFLIKKGLIQKVVLKPVTRNMVVSVNFGEPVNLEDLTFKEHIIYEPEQFPAGILKIFKPYKASVLIFGSGKVVVTGLTSTSQIDSVIERLNSLLKEVD